MDIDASIDALVNALVAADVEPPRPPSDLRVLGEISAAIDPLRLPDDLRRFWERVDPSTFKAEVFPSPIQPQFALRNWQTARKEYPGHPAILFMVGSTSWSCMSIELDGTHGEEGSLFRWRVDGGDFHLRYHRLGDWLARMAHLITIGSYERNEGERGAHLWLKDEEDELPLAKLREGLRPHPVHGETFAIPRDPLKWPAHWQRASGLEPEEILPRGATHTIAEVLASDPATAMQATIAGRVVSLAGSNKGTRVRVTDHTETIDVFCPAAITALGPIVRECFEFDVVVPPGHRRRASDAEVKPQDPDDAVEALTASLLSRYGGPLAVVASAVRPVRPEALSG